MLECLKIKLGDSYEIVSQGGGLAILINPKCSFDWDKFKDLAEKNMIKLYFAKDRSGGDFEAIRLGFGGFSEEKIIEAIDALSKIWHQSILK